MMYTKLFGEDRFEYENTNAEGPEDLTLPFENISSLEAHIGIGFHCCQQGLGAIRLNGIYVFPLLMDQTSGEEVSLNDIVEAQKTDIRYRYPTRLKDLLK